MNLTISIYILLFFVSDITGLFIALHCVLTAGALFLLSFDVLFQDKAIDVHGQCKI